MMQNKKRIGKFYINTEVIFANETVRILEQMEFVPLRVENLAFRGCFEYIGVSPMFDELGIGAVEPEYEIIADKTEAGDLTVSVKKMDY